MPTPAHTTWSSTAKTTRALRFSRTTLQKLKRAGILKPGTHYYRRGLGRTAPCAWNIDACRETLLRLAAADPSALETYDIPRTPHGVELRGQG
ncbi:MAG: hypothetical protein WBM08_09410 [Prochlorococcaceae cyanobacterium]